MPEIPYADLTGDERALIDVAGAMLASIEDHGGELVLKRTGTDYRVRIAAGRMQIRREGHWERINVRNPDPNHPIDRSDTNE
jgi:hypothetical protein